MKNVYPQGEKITGAKAQANKSNDLPQASEAAQIATRGSGLRNLASLMPFIKRYPKMVCAVIASLILASIATLSLPAALRFMIDNGFSADRDGVMNTYFLCLFFIGTLLAVASAARFYTVHWVGERLVADLRRDVFAHLANLSPAFFDKNHSGELMSRLASDATLINTAVRASVSQALRNIMVLSGALILMFVTSAKLSLLVLLIIPMVVLPLIFYGRAVRRLSRKAQDMEAGVHMEGAEVLGNIRTVQAYNAQTQHMTRFTGRVEHVFEAAKARMMARSGLTALAIFLVFTGVLGILWYGAGEVAKGTISTGLLGQFVLYSVLAAGSLGALTEVWGELAQAAGAAERLNEFLDVKSSVVETANPVPFKARINGKISFEKVNFSYGDQASVLHAFDLQVKAGETVAIVGASGAGKSTLFQLLTRFYDVTAGRILLDGVDIRDVRLDELRDQMALVLQDPVLFDATVADNIAYGREGTSLDKIKQAARFAAADGFVNELEHGYDTRLGEKGVLLSGGQRQRIALARAFLKDAPLLLLDEATSALDGESEAQITTALSKLMTGRTTLVIAHRLATIRHADRIIVLEDGHVAEEGTHNELIKKGGIYARLADLQFQSSS